MIEAKLGEIEIKSHCYNFAKELNVPLIQVVHKQGVYKKVKDKVQVISADRFLSTLP